MRLIDANALKEDFKQRYEKAEQWIEKAKDEEIKIRATATRDFIAEVIMTINNAPTVDYPFYQEAYQTGYEEGKNERPQGEFVKMLNERIEKGVCKFCQMNKHCELCEISRVFMIIALTDKEMNEGGADMRGNDNVKT